MSNPLISVIMPAYNGERYIRAALDSALAQTYRPFEIIVVDDASKDGTAAAAASYGDRIRLIRREQNSGICEIARTQGIREARGDLLAFLDQDDLWEPGKLEAQTAFMLAHPDIPLSHTAMRVIDEEGRAEGVRHEGAIPPTGPCARELLRHPFVTISAIMVRKDVWLSAYDVSKLKDAHSDYDYFLSILRAHPAGFGFLPEVLGSYRRGSQNMSRQNWRRFPEDVVSLERVWCKRLWAGLVSKVEMKSALCVACEANAEHQLYHGMPSRALHFAFKAVRYTPSSAHAWSLLGRALLRIVHPVRP